jgi:hypothetical protein
MKLKKCKKCNETKPTWDFKSYTSKSGELKKQSICDKCVPVSMTSEETKLKRRANRLKLKYNLSLEDYNAMFSRQNGKCSICKKHQTKLDSALCVDHCHKTGKVRGLLCSNCNLALGLLNDNCRLLLEAINYIELHSGITYVNRTKRHSKFKRRSKNSDNSNFPSSN